MRGAAGGPGSLPERFRRHLDALDAVDPGDRLVVALSGGLDSTVLAHLLRFAPGAAGAGGIELVLAHLDHGMRPSSVGDAAWVRGVARAWDLPLRERRLDAAPSTEEEAREARYGWLRGVREAEGARWIVTAHHADDQAETVLFRAVRGTGLRGLGGMAPRFVDWSVLRPLLPFWREELRAYAERVGLGWRDDPTNLDSSARRNVLRAEVLPLLERDVAPSARRALTRLARRARRSEAGFRSLLEPVIEGLVEERAEDAISVARPGFLAYHPEVRARVIRELARRLGSRLSGAGTRVAVQFTKRGRSGGGVDVGDGLRLERSFDTLVLRRTGSAPRGSDASVEIAGPGEGRDTLHLGPRSWSIAWSPDARTGEAGGAPPDAWRVHLHREGSRFPLRMRGWRHGDRIRMGYGSKKLSKLFAEAKVAARERAARPVLEDAVGRILWVPGVRGATRADAGLVEDDPRGHDDRPGILTIEVRDARQL